MTSSVATEMHSGSESTWQPPGCPWITVELNDYFGSNELVITEISLKHVSVTLL